MTLLLSWLRPLLGPLVLPAALFVGWSARGLWDAPGHARALEAAAMAARAACAAEAKARADAATLKQLEIFRDAVRPPLSAPPAGGLRPRPGCRDCPAASGLPELRGAP